MKRIYILIAVFSVFLLQNCSDDDFRAFSETQVQIDKSDVTFTSEGGKGEIVVLSSEGAITATADETWCEVTVSGHKISVTVGENISLNARTALVTIRSNDKVNYVPVYQEPLRIILEANTASFLGEAGSKTVTYQCSEQITKAESDKSWLKVSVSGENIVVTVTENPSFTNNRTGQIKLTTEGNSAVTHLKVVQRGFVTSYKVADDVKSIDAFLNLKNNAAATPTSRYKITSFSTEMDEFYGALKLSYPMIKEMRIETPRGSNKLSVSIINVIGNTQTIYYWNASNSAAYGLLPIDGSNSVAYFSFSGNSYLGENPAYATDFNHTRLREIFAATTGFTIIPDPSTSNVFWFRSMENPVCYFKAEPATWE